MARRRDVPPVARPTGARRFLEWAKNLLILALTCSAVFLALQTPMAAEVRSWMDPAGWPAQSVERQRSEAVTPCTLAVRSELGLYGLSGDVTGLTRDFGRFSALLGKALDILGSSETIQAAQWRTLLEAPGVYCAFQCAPPLSVLGAFLGEGSGLSGSAQSLLLSWDGSRVWLAWREGKGYYRLPTQLSYEQDLKPLVEEFSPNGAAFAYTLAASDETYNTLDPYVLVSMTASQPQIYTALSPDFVRDREALEQLLSALGFQSGAASAYESGGELALNESGDRLRVGSQGQVTFHAGEEDRYPVTGEGSRITAAEAASAAWDLLNRAAGPWKGELSFVLTGLERTQAGWLVTFHGRLNGLPLTLGEEGWCAQITVEERKISDFTLTLRAYTPTGETSVVPSERLAAAALKSLPQAGGRLMLSYSDNGGGTLSALWLALE